MPSVKGLIQEFRMPLFNDMTNKKVFFSFSFFHSGRSIQVLITVAGANKVRRGSLTLKFITKYGELISSHSLPPRGKKSVHYISTFTAPSQPFRIQLDGTTTSGGLKYWLTLQF